jgi:hypothetical protein
MTFDENAADREAATKMAAFLIVRLGPTKAIGEDHGFAHLHTAPAAQSLFQTIVDRAGHL